MYTIELYVPGKDNDGNNVWDKLWPILEEKIVEYFGGFSRYYVHGRYKDFAEEVVLVYRILASTFGPNHREQTNEIAGYVKEHWRQDSVLWTLTEIGEINFV
jgi:hypothetical protein